MVIFEIELEDFIRFVLVLIIGVNGRVVGLGREGEDEDEEKLLLSEESRLLL